MTKYRRAGHTTYQLHYHFVFITKYRKPALRGEVGKRVRELIREICGYFVTTTGTVTDEVIAEYIDTQDVERQDDDFKVVE